MVSDDDIIREIRRPGKFDAIVPSEDDARRLIREAMPDATELRRAIGGHDYPAPPGERRWFQVHPPEPSVANDMPHLKYADWTGGKKGRGGSWGHLFFPPEPTGPDT